jgi:hypothetical protein
MMLKPELIKVRPYRNDTRWVFGLVRRNMTRKVYAQFEIRRRTTHDGHTSPRGIKFEIKIFS